MNIVITGASKGIGYETALAFSEKGQHTILAISRSRSRLITLSEKGSSSPSRIYPLVLDLSSRGWERRIQKVTRKVFHGRVDVLINNAGLLIKKDFMRLSDGEWEQIYSVNFFSVVRMIRCLLPFMGKRKASSHIINISSIGGFQGSVKFRGLSAYSSSKAALSGLTECLAEELKGRNVHINALCFGSVQTEMFRKAFPGSKAGISGKEAGNFISDFVLNASQYFNGKVLPVSASTP